MRVSIASVAAAVSLAIAHLSLPASAVTCTGGGDEKWCTRREKGATPAHQIDYCPKVCSKKNCEDVKPAMGERRGIFLDYFDDDSDDTGIGQNWEQIARAGKYEHVYASDDKLVCLASCWLQPWISTCDKWHEALGRRYCIQVNCEYDTFGVDGGNRFAGCHENSRGGLKKDWHRPTCNECIQLFPACYDELKSFADRDDDRAVEAIDDAIQTEAQEYCFNNYFQEFGGTFIADTTEPEPVIGRRLKSSGDDDSDESDSDESDSDESDSDEEDSDSTRFGLNGPSWSRQVENYATETVRDMIGDGRLRCPPAQCLTNDLDLFSSFAGVTPTFNGPWYHAITGGFCAWRCDVNPLADRWCSRSVENCMTCKSTWCPPYESLPWDPVTLDTYEPKPEWYEATTEGFCAWNTNCNARYPVPNPWCGRELGNCHACRGTWCPPTVMRGTWEPVPSPGSEPLPGAANAMQRMPMISKSPAMAAGLAEMEEMPMFATDYAMAPGPAGMDYMPMLTVESAMAPGPEEGTDVSMELAAMAPAEMLIEMEDMEVMAEAPGPAGMGRKMLSTGGNAPAGGGGYLQALLTFADRSRCPKRIVGKDVSVQDFLG